MTLLAAAILALAGAGAGVARIEAISLVSLESGPAVLVRCSAEPGLVAVHRDGEVARVSLTGVQLGLQFSGSSQFEWTRAAGAPSASYPIEVLRVESGARFVHLYLRVPPEVPIQASRKGLAVAIELRETPSVPAIMRAAASPGPLPSRKAGGAEPDVEIAAARQQPEPPEVAPTKPAEPEARPPQVAVAEAQEPFQPVPVSPSEPVDVPEPEPASAAPVQPTEPISTAPTEPAETEGVPATARVLDAEAPLESSPEPALQPEEAESAPTAGEPSFEPVPVSPTGPVETAAAEPAWEEAVSEIALDEPQDQAAVAPPKPFPAEQPEAVQPFAPVEVAEPVFEPVPIAPLEPVETEPRERSAAVAEAAPVEAPPAPAPEAAEPADEPSTRDTAELYAQLFPQGVESGQQSEQGVTDAAGAEAAPAVSAETLQLYAQLFPPPPVEQEAPVGRVEPMDDEETQGTFPLGFLRVRPAVSISYVNVNASVLDTPEPVRDRFLQVQPALNARGVLWDGRLTADYEPSLRGFGTLDVLNTTSHSARAALELQPGDRLRLDASARYFTGALETQLADSGREYFFDLGRFSRQDYTLDVRFQVGPRSSLDMGGRYGRVRFKEPSGFFDYDSEGARVGLGYELSPNLRATLEYAFDRVPTPPERPEAEARAHNAHLTLTGDITPLLTGRISAGYRDQRSPNAAEGGRRFQGLTASAELTKVLTRTSSLTLRLDRSTPVSAFEQNAFYVTTGLQGTLSVPLPLALRLTSGAGYQWSDYRTPALELGVPREDRIFGWYVGLRRVLFGRAHLSADYRREERSSNLDEFDVVNDGFVLRLEINVFDTWSGR